MSNRETPNESYEAEEINRNVLRSMRAAERDTVIACIDIAKDTMRAASKGVFGKIGSIEQYGNLLEAEIRKKMNMSD